MRKSFFLIEFLVVAFLISSPVFSQETESSNSSIQFTPAQQKLVDEPEALTASTMVDGKGIEAYQSYLHSDFSRWSAGNGEWGREKTVQQIGEWWEAGNRMSLNDNELISVTISQNTGVLRKLVSESYVDAKGNDIGSFRGYTTQVWVKENEQWKLLAITIQKDDP